MQDNPKISDQKGLLIAALLMIDSLHFVFARLMLPHIEPAVSAMYVMMIGMAVVGVYGFIRGQIKIDLLFKNIWFFLSVGLLVAVSTNINYEAVAFIDAGTAAILGKTSILFGLGYGLFWLKEDLNRPQIAGAVVAIVGVLVITFQPGDYLRTGSLMILGSACMYALHAAIVKRFGQNMEFINFFFFRLFCTSAILFVMAVTRKSLVVTSATAWGLLILVGTLDVAISRGLYYLALRRLKLSIHAIILTLSPVAAILWALYLFDTLPNIQQAIGGVGVIIGVMVVLLNSGK
jgi:drug/metabolite transporter (DMT)-like permease